jgi:hypothetical protein
LSSSRPRLELVEQAVGTRLTALEAERNKVASGAALVAWLVKAAPWLLGPALGAAFASILGFKQGGS